MMTRIMKPRLLYRTSGMCNLFHWRAKYKILNDNAKISIIKLLSYESSLCSQEIDLMQSTTHVCDSLLKNCE